MALMALFPGAGFRRETLPLGRPAGLIGGGAGLVLVGRHG
jgi:hypothetical protein